MEILQRDFPALVARAEQIVVGTVTDIHEAIDAHGAPATYVTLSDLTVLKGTVGDTLTLRFYGGRAGNVVVGIPDMPTFAVGERPLLFIAGNGSSVCPLVGVWQGQFRVRLDAQSGAEIVEDHAGVPVTGISGGHLMRSDRSSATTQTAMTLDAFRQRVADELARPQPTAAAEN